MVNDINEVSNSNDPFLGYFNPPGETYEGIGVFNAEAWDRSAGGDLDIGGFGFVTIVHELLHGLGLAHPHDNGGTSSVMAGVTEDFDDYGRDNLNQGVYTTMSYNSGYHLGGFGANPSFNSNYGYEAGPMALDIAVLQSLYGASSRATGKNTYWIDGSNGAGTHWKTIWDTGGVDTFQYNGNRDVVIDLRAATLLQEPGGGGFLSAVKNIAGGLTIAHGVVIENANAGSGDDKLMGNDAGNLMRGNNGKDQLNGRAGDDRLFGGSQNDIINGGRDEDRIGGGNGADKLYGGIHADRLSGNNGKDLIYGNDGGDRVNGNNGHDTLYGQDGRDFLGGGDGNDWMYGGESVDTLTGADGDDRLYGGGARDDMTGGKGADRFIYNTVGNSRDGVQDRDVITDFGRGNDVIVLRNIDADTTRGGNQNFSFIGKRALDDAGDLRVSQRGKDWLVQGDTNGDGKADFEIYLENADRPYADDFVL